MVEPGSEAVATAWEGSDLLFAGRLLYAEARAGLAAAARQGRIPPPQLPPLKRELDVLFQDLDVWEAVKPIVDRAGDLAEQHRLRGCDAVHLATALAAGADVMVTADADLVRAGPECGLGILDVRT